MTFANNLDPDEAPQNVGLHLRSKLFDIQIIYRHKTLVGNKDFWQILKKKVFKKNYPAYKELKNMSFELRMKIILTSILFFTCISICEEHMFHFPL